MPKLTRIHIRRDLIGKDRKDRTNSAAIGVETSGMRKRYGRSVVIEGPCTILYRPNNPLHCGARAWIETASKVRVLHRGR